MKNILTKEGEMSIDFEDNLYQDAKISDVGLPTYWGHPENVHFILKRNHPLQYQELSSHSSGIPKKSTRIRSLVILAYLKAWIVHR